MRQIRYGLFETNSSTTHSLTIARGVVTPEIIEEFKKKNGTHIIFGVNSYDDIYKLLWKNIVIDENTDFQIKADILYFSMYVWVDGNGNIAEFLHDRKVLEEKLNELGFTVEFREDPKVIEEYDWHMYDLSYNPFECMFRDINEVIDYLFYNHVLYYRWCDECSAREPEEITEAEIRFEEYKKTEETHNYSYR